MSYNRLGSGGNHQIEDNEEGNFTSRYNRPVDPRVPLPGGGIPSSPGVYQMQQRRPLEMPSGPPSEAPSDRLAGQPTYSVEGFNHSYRHNEAYDAQYPAKPYEHSIHPTDHQDAYYNEPYQPSVPGQDQDYYDDVDTRPMLQTGHSYSPGPQSPFEENPMPEPVPTIRRWKTVKEVQLFNGNLVLDCPIPPRLLNQVPHAQPPERDEFTHMRYSAATCDPSEFAQHRFTLRQRLFAKPRRTELFIVITMYNEEDDLFARTFIGVVKNIEYMNARTNSKTWGKDAWKKIVVCVVSDGRAKINPRTRAVLAALGVYQEGIAKEAVNKKPVTAHIYEYTTQMTLTISKGVVGVKKADTPIQVLFCLKEKNQKKINSHRWFFQAFGECLQPNVCVLIDAGTKPGGSSIYKLWKAFDINPNCAGACGEIEALLDRGKNLINPLVATQNFEYKMSNILDKPMESAFGFISVLPGAFSAYRYLALQNDKTGRGPLEKYFAGEKMHNEAGVFTANMYLAEDRILCFELVSKRKCSWVLQYVKGSTGETDVPTEMADFILQRRRWLNGSFFAAVYALAHSYQIFRSSHSLFRNLMFFVEFIYQTISMIFAWFALGNFYLIFKILTDSLGDEAMLNLVGHILAVVSQWAYLGTLITCFVLALGNRPQGSNRLYMSMVYFWVIIMAYLLFASVFISVRVIQSELKKPGGFVASELLTNKIISGLIVSMASTYVLWLVISIISFDPWHMVTCFIQYLLLTPTYINILNVYAFCNTHDITWGTKGDTKAEKLPTANVGKDGKLKVDVPTEEADLNTQYEKELVVFSRALVIEKKALDPAEKQEDYYKGFRSVTVLAWMFTNLALCAVVLNTGGTKLKIDNQSSNDSDTERKLRTGVYLHIVLWSVAGMAAFRFIGAIWFLVVRLVSCLSLLGLNLALIFRR